MSLDALRTEINQIDAELVRLLDRRARTGRAIGRVKAELGLPLFQPGREEEVLGRIAGLSAGDFPGEDLLAVYRLIMQTTLSVQRPGAGGNAAAEAKPDSGAATDPATQTPSGCAGHAAAKKRDVPARILENSPVALGLYRMRLAASGLHFVPGQFFQLRIPNSPGLSPRQEIGDGLFLRQEIGDGLFLRQEIGDGLFLRQEIGDGLFLRQEIGDGLFLRRPFAPSSFDERGLTFYYATVGRGTERLTHMPPGTKVALLAPLGRGYALLPAGRRAVILGGGAGAPSLAPLAHALRAAGAEVTVLLGARTAGLLAAEAFAGLEDSLLTATDDGTAGTRGTVVDAYRAEWAGRPAPDRFYCCGPMPMLRAAAGLAAELGSECEVSLEERMACGFGACVGCAVPVLDASVGAGVDAGAGAEGGTRYERVCHDGPVFDARRLAWSEMR